ncbi:glycosyltransferase [Falsibacillus pallidus]|uniref:glycosyltransferase n=1 Tax=Falsibacillus pallidus TaxID=493781 RepID=UPI003D988B56
MPKISVIMGVYNGEKYLHDAIKSILNQSFKDFEFIICDDGSTDKSVNIIEHYKKNDKRILFLQNDKNIGLAATLNKCITVADGEYIARMDCDDVSLLDRFNKQVDFLDNNKNIALVGGNANLFNDKGIYGIRKMEGEYTRLNVFKKNFFIHPTVMMRKKSVVSIGGYTESKYTYRTEDYDLWCKFCEKGYKGFNIDEILLNYREDETAYRKRKFKYRVDAFKLRVYWFKKLKISYKYVIYLFKPLIIGLLPTLIMKKYHVLKSKN